MSAAPTPSQLFTTWLRIGATSFGGGVMTQYLIQEHFIHRNHWVTETEYSQILAMSQLSPGMALIAICILLGKRLGGTRGVTLSLLGLILPSALITVGLTAAYTLSSQLPHIQAMLRGVFAAIFGVGLVTNWRNIHPVLVRAQKRGPIVLGIALSILLGCASCYLLFHPPVGILYLVGGLCGSVGYACVAKHRKVP